MARAARAAEAAPMAVDLIAAPARCEDEEWIESFDDHYQAPFWTNARTGVATWLYPKGGASGAI